MKIYDITQELFGGKVYPGDPAPSYERILTIEKGDPCNLTKFQMCAHNATHMDAPAHYYTEGKTIEQVELSSCVGPCSVIDLTDCGEAELIKRLETCQKRLLIKGDGVVTLERAKLFIRYGIVLVGIEGQSVGPDDSHEPVHFELLGKEVVILEGLVLKEVTVGEYFLSAAPLKLGGSEGAPCRAILLQMDNFSL